MNAAGHLSGIFLVLYALAIAAEAALGRAGWIRARYRGPDTLASLAMSGGNLVMNLLMAGVVYAGLAFAWRLRVFSISPSSVWATSSTRLPITACITPSTHAISTVTTAVCS